MKRFPYILFIIFLLFLLPLASFAEDISNFKKVSLPSKLTLPVYSAPSTNAWRGANGKAEASSNETIYAAGWDGDWLLLLYGTSGGASRAGYTPRSALKGSDPKVPELHFEHTSASISSSCTLTDDPKKGKNSITTLSTGTKITYLASFTDNSSNGDGVTKAYIEATVSGKTARGFVPMHCVNLNKAATVTVKPVHTIAPAVTTQAGKSMFIGTVDGEQVVAYLDHAFADYWDKKTDHVAYFVSFNADGSIQYRFSVRVEKGASTGVYNATAKSLKVSAGFHEIYLTSSGLWSGGYSMSNTYASGDRCRVTLTRANTERDNSDICGNVEGYMYPGKYGSNRSKSRVYITGSFQYSIGEVHPIMQSYRANNPAYHAAQPNGSTLISIEFPITHSNDSISDGTYNERLCYSCGGSGNCITCSGTGRLLAVQDTLLGSGCRTCSSTGDCNACGGDGYR